jgi:transcriptional regulator of acetoin/glycerol metabolism
MLDICKAQAYSRQVETREPLTVERVRAALVAANGSVTVAAKTLQVSRQTVYDWMEKHSITVERVVKAA